MSDLTLNENGEAPAPPIPSALARTIDEFIAKGYHPIPVMPRDKAPGEYQGSIEHGRWTLAYGWNEFSKRKPEPAMVHRWKTWPDANIGIVLGTPVGGYQLICIDFDTDDQDELDQLQSQLPPSRMMKRGHRGFSAFYRAGKDVRTKRYMIADPTAATPSKKRCVLEILTGNAPRQTVMPPSWHPNSGREYEWLTGDEIVPVSDLPVLSDHHFEQLEDTLEGLGWGGDIAAPVRDRADRETARDTDDPNIWRETNDIALQKMDLWVRDLGLPKLKRHPNGSWEAVPTWRASNENRPTMQRKSNLKFHREGIKDMGTDVGYTALDVVGAAFSWDFDTSFEWLRDKLGLSDKGFDVVDRPRQLIEQADGALADAETGEIVPARVSVDRELPAHLTHVPGLLGDMVDWIEATARRQNRVLSLGAAIVTLGTLAGRRDATPTKSGLHLYVLGLAPSGAGKQHGLDAAAKLIEAAGATRHLAAPEAMSQTALIAELKHEPLLLSLADEIGAYLNRINGPRAGAHDVGIKKVLRSAWGASFRTMLTPSWAQSAPTPIHSPSLSIYGVSTPAEVYAALTGADVVNGLLNRFLLLTTKVRSGDVDPELDFDQVPDALANRLIGLYEARGRHSLAATVGNASPSTAAWGDGAHALYKAFSADCEQRAERDESIAPYLARTAEMAVRLATIRAIGRNADWPSVSVEDMAWGRDLALWSAERMAEEAGDHVADTETARTWSKILRKLESSLTGRVGKTEVQNCIGRTAKETDGAIRDLVGMGRITIEEIKPQRGPTKKMIALVAR